MPNTIPQLTPKQQAAVMHAHTLAAIPSADDEALAVFTGHDDLATVYAAAYAEARHTIRGLLAVIDALAGGER
jgi:hypothetical protein